MTRDLRSQDGILEPVLICHEGGSVKVAYSADVFNSVRKARNVLAE